MSLKEKEICSVEGCPEPFLARGFCYSHYWAAVRDGSIATAPRVNRTIDETGKRYGRLRVLERVANKGTAAVFRCECDCGNLYDAIGSSLRDGSAKSCGCLRREAIYFTRQTKHGLAHTREYRNWLGMKQRCFNPKTPHFENYGGRGITVYAGWVNDFQAFHDYVSKLPHFGEKGRSFDRFPDNDGNYEPGNVRWATDKEQAANQTRGLIAALEAARREGSSLSNFDFVAWASEVLADFERKKRTCQMCEQAINEGVICSVCNFAIERMRRLGI